MSKPTGTGVLAALGVAVLLLVGACRKYPFVYQEQGVVEASNTEDTNLTSTADILFVMDNSGSMAEEQANVKANLIGFITELSATPTQFRIALITTDNQTQPAAPGQTASCTNPTVPAGVDPTHHGRCGRLLAPAGKPGFLDRASFATPLAMAQELGTYIDLLKTDGSAWEEPMKSAYLALDPALSAAGAPNAGFFREDALLVIAMVTDESDCSFEDDATGRAAFVTGSPGLTCYSKASQLVSPIEWASRIAARKGDPRFVRVGLISAAVPDASGKLSAAACVIDSGGQASGACDCFLGNGAEYCPYTRAGTVSFSGACGPPSRTCCTALANDRLLTFAGQFIGVTDTICNPSYSSTLVNLAKIANRQCLGLNKKPLEDDPSNIEVKLRRTGTDTFVIVPQTADESGSGWYYSATPSPIVCLAGEFKRDKGDTLRVFVVDTLEGETATAVP